MYGQQTVATRFWPDKKCEKCLSTGYIGLRSTKPVQLPKIQVNKPCPCGSKDLNGNFVKYKKCCKKRIDELKKSESTILVCTCVGDAKAIVEPNTEQLQKIVKELQNE
jgi:hypothetical protein